MRISIGVIFLVAGCATVDPRVPLADVQTDLHDRQSETIAWRSDSDADREVDTRIAALLAGELSADSAVQIALLNNRNLQATYESLGIAQADLVEAGLLKNPVFDAQIRFAEGGGGTGVELGLIFEFLDVLYIPMRRSIAQANLDAAKRDVARIVVDLASDVRRAFYEYQAAEQTLELRKTIVASTAASLELAQRLHKAGNFTDLNLASEQALHEQSKLDLADAEVQTLRVRERLNVLMGVWGGKTNWQGAARLADPDDASAPTDIEKRAIERSLVLAAGRARIAQSTARLGLAKPLGWLSELELGVAAERETEGGWSVGPAVALPIPIFSQGQPALARRQAELRRDLARHSATAVQVRSAARFTAARLAAARHRVEFFRKTLLPLREQIMDQTQRQFNAMQIGAFGLLAAKREQIETGRAYIAALREYWLARADLSHLLAGGLPRGEMPNSAIEGPSLQSTDTH
jgi:cobalt-zinc-cadmium efflux system outer membrane protein